MGERKAPTAFPAKTLWWDSIRQKPALCWVNLAFYQIGLHDGKWQRREPLYTSYIFSFLGLVDVGPNVRGERKKSTSALCVLLVACWGLRLTGLGFALPCLGHGALRSTRACSLFQSCLIYFANNLLMRASVCVWVCVYMSARERQRQRYTENACMHTNVHWSDFSFGTNLFYWPKVAQQKHFSGWSQLQNLQDLLTFFIDFSYSRGNALWENKNQERATNKICGCREPVSITRFMERNLTLLTWSLTEVRP